MHSSKAMLSVVMIVAGLVVGGLQSLSQWLKPSRRSTRRGLAANALRSEGWAFLQNRDRYKGKDEDPLNAGRELKARAVITGRVSMRGNQLIIQCDVMDVSRATQIWDLVPADWEAPACALAGRSLTHQEWDKYFANAGPYRPTCSRSA